MNNHTIYRIVNTVTGKCYVGQTVNLKQRMVAHFSSLKTGKHQTPRLQKAYNECGRDAFKVEVLEENVLTKNVDAREMFWIRHFNSQWDGYNGSKGSAYHYEGMPTEYQEMVDAEAELWYEIQALREEMRPLEERLKKLYDQKAAVDRIRARMRKEMKNK